MSTNLTKREIVLEIYRKTGFPQKQIVDPLRFPDRLPVPTIPMRD